MRTRFFAVVVLVAAACGTPAPAEKACALGHGGCDENATCTTNDDGTPSCACKSGYTGDGKTCQAEASCAANNGGCDANADCSVSGGALSCTCKTGFTGDGKTCQAEASCTKDNGGCDLNAECAMDGGAVSCTCMTGFTGDGKTCSDAEPPVLTVASPADGALFSLSSPASLQVKGSVSDVSTVTLTLSVDGGAAQDLPVSDGAFLRTLPLADEDSVKHVLVFVARDAANRQTTVVRAYTVDRVPPALVISTPAADAACAEVCTGAVVNLQSGATYAFAGTATDGGGLDATTLKAAIGDQTADLTADPAWTYSWSALPSDDGAAYTFRLSASDKAGNRGEATRKVWVDRVPPTCTGTQDQKRLVPRTAELLRCSEAMDVASVQAATQFNGAVDAAWGSLDGKSFEASALAPYTLYDVILATAARDRSGNPIAAQVAQQFLTEAVLPTSLPPDAVFIETDLDGLPYVVTSESVCDDGNGYLLPCNFHYAWDGRGAFVKHALDFYYNASLARGGVTDFAVLSSPRKGSLSLDNLVVALGTEWDMANTPYVATIRLDWTTDLTTWNHSESSDSDSYLHAALERTYSDQCEHLTGGVCDQWSVTKSFARLFQTSGDPTKVQRVADPAAAWSTATTRYQSATPVRGSGGVALANDKVVYLPAATPALSILSTASSIRVIGLQQRVGTNPTTGGQKAIGAGLVAWAEQVKTATEDYPALFIGCSETASFGATWLKSVDLTPVPAGNRNAGLSIYDIRMASNDSTAAIAVKTSDGNLYWASFSNTCATLPASLAWSAAVKNGSAALAVAPDGTIWKAQH
ncbi:MAG TPA: EGF domain-containing protein [Myxococcales bacterium]|jgi:hypothetical protein